MNDTPKAIIDSMLVKQRKFYSTTQTKNLVFRIEQFKKFKAAKIKYEKKNFQICE
jgi:hypothetical protein